MTHEEPKPRDQVNRDWTKGNCYYIALEFIKDFPGLRAHGHFAPDTEAFVVHGVASGVKHAWVELTTGDVFDHSNNRGLRIAKSDYYEIHAAQEVRRFSRREADALLARAERSDPSFGNLAWHEVTNDDVRTALSEYDEQSAPFARGVVFSDPSDDANSDRIQRPGESPGGRP